MDAHTMITLTDYFMGRDITHIGELSDAARQNARVTYIRINKLIQALASAEIIPEKNPATGSFLTSGWRPASLNAKTPGAAIRSKHITCEACDLYDPHGDLDEWCMTHQNELTEIGLWLEHPSATKNWCHVQTVPPRSGRRVFYP